MISHINFGVSDFERAFSFYGAVFAVLGLELKFKESEKSWAAWQSPGHSRPLIIIGKPFDGADPLPGNGLMTAFQARDRIIVDKSHEKALEFGGTSEGEPGLRPQYHENYYGAYFRDPDGNKLCVCCHDPA